jgi:RNA polymerase sigma factor (sigma-70 family)
MDRVLDVEELSRRYAPMVMRRCRQLLRNEDEALDACQDVFVRLVENRRRLDDRYPSSLLYRMATNVCLNRIRDRGRRPETADQERLHEIAAAGDPRARLIRAFDATAELATSPRCLGCAFQAAASEFPETAHPGHQVAMDHKRRVLGRLAELAHEAGLRDPDGLADQLLLLMDGAWVAARMFGPDNHARSIAEAARTLIDAHARPAGTARTGRQR